MKLILYACPRRYFNIPNVRSNIHVPFLPVLPRDTKGNCSVNITNLTWLSWDRNIISVLRVWWPTWTTARHEVRNWSELYLKILFLLS